MVQSLENKEDHNMMEIPQYHDKNYAVDIVKHIKQVARKMVASPWKPWLLFKKTKPGMLQSHGSTLPWVFFWGLGFNLILFLFIISHLCHNTALH